MIERRVSVPDNVNDYVNDYDGCREAALSLRHGQLDFGSGTSGHVPAANGVVAGRVVVRDL